MNAVFVLKLKHDFLVVPKQYTIMRSCEALGFNRNNAIVSLMPLLTYISEKTV